MGDKREALLDTVVSKGGFSYLSDINVPSNKEKVKYVLESIDEQAYDMEEWRDIVRYITGKKTSIADKKQAKEEVLKQLES